MNGIKKGYGLYEFRDGSVYNGWFDKDDRWGPGIMIFTNNDKYEGNWLGSLKNGFGKYYYNNGEIYEGQVFDFSTNLLILIICLKEIIILLIFLFLTKIKGNETWT